MTIDWPEVQSATRATQMYREIAEQPNAAARTLAALLPMRTEVATLARPTKSVLFAARGSSDNAAQYGRYLIETRSGRVASLLSPSIATHYRRDLDLRDSLVVCVSQSGATTEIVDTAQWARGCGARTLGITNVEKSPLADATDLTMVTRAGPEVAVPATKSYLTQLLAMAALGTALDPTDAAPLDEQLHQIPEALRELLDKRAGIREATQLIAEAKHVIVTGRGLMLGTALETALKLEETCLAPVRGYSYADLRHGPMSVVNGQIAVIAVAASDGPMLQPMTALVDELRAKGATVIGVGGDATFAAACTSHLTAGSMPEAVAPITSIVPAQLLIAHVAIHLGLNPDQPPHLAKVTRTDSNAGLLHADGRGSSG